MSDPARNPLNDPQSVIGHILVPREDTPAEGDETIHHFAGWTRKLQNALESIEADAFVPELRYSAEELMDRAGNAGFEGLLLEDLSGPSAIMLVYLIERGDQLYLDTLAVRDRGRGTGTRLLRFLIHRCEHAGITEIRLDTEAGVRSMKGDRSAPHDLSAYYRRFGFEELPPADAVETVPGNVAMRLRLNR